MYTYRPSSKTNCLNSSKLYPEFVEHFKGSNQAPKRRSKENEEPRQISLNKTEPRIETKSELRLKDSNQLAQDKSRIVECDISKIAHCYVLEGNMLKKREPYMEVKEKQKKKQLQVNKQNSAIEKKEIFKLQYLQKMGFLRPEEKKILADYRKSHPQPTQTKTSKKEIPAKAQVHGPQQPSHELGLYSPKMMDPKKLSQFYSPAMKMNPIFSHY